jgi:hypothetical protein
LLLRYTGAASSLAPDSSVIQADGSKCAAISVTRERIRQIEAKALRKLKHPSRSRKLRSFLDN